MPPPAPTTNFCIYPSDEARILDQYIDQGMMYQGPEGSGLPSIPKAQFLQRKQLFDTQQKANAKQEYDDLKLKLAGASADPKIKFDDANLAVHIDYGFKEFIDKFPEAAKKARDMAGGPDTDLLQDVFLASFATTRVKKEHADEQETACDSLRDDGYKDPSKPLNQPGGNPTDSGQGDQLLNDQDALCVADDHKKPDTREFLAGNMKKLAAAGVKTVFLEHFWQEHQAALDEYLKPGYTGPLPSGLKEAVEKLDYDTSQTPAVKKFADGSGFADVLQQAKAEGVRIVALDDFPAKVTSNDAFADRRAARFNHTAAEVIKKNTKKGEKFLIVAGEAHLNTHECGVPGLAQIFGTHVIEPSGGKLTQKPENKKRRGMRSKKEQLFLDSLNDALRKGHPGKAEDGVYETARVMAKQYANQLDLMSLAGVKQLAEKVAGQVEEKLKQKAVPLALGKVVELTDELKEDAKTSPTTKEKASFLKAVKDGDWKAATDLAKADPRLCLATMPDGKTALHLALNNRLALESLLKLMDPNAADKNGNTPLHDACAQGSEGSIGLLAMGTDLTRANAKGKLPRDVIDKKDAKTKALLDKETNTAMMMAASNNNLPLLKDFIEKLGCDVQYAAEDGRTLLHTSVSNNASEELVQYLLDKKVDPNVKDKQGNAPLHVAKNVPLLNLLEKNGAKLDVKNNDGETPLLCALNSPDPLPLMDRLLALGSQIDEKGNDGRTLLHRAAARAKPQVLQHLLDKGADFNAKDKENNTPLHLACKYAGTADAGTLVTYPACTKKLLDKGADPNQKNGEGSTPLHLAAYCGGQANITHIFNNVTKPVDLKLVDNHGMRAVDLSVGSGRKAVEQMFYAKQPNLDSDIHNLNPSDEVSPVDLLMKATVCESEATRKRMKKMFDELYEDPALRPILKLAALDTFGTRDGTGKPALRIFATDTDLTASVREGGGGSYETSSNTLVLGSVDKEKCGAKGTLIHELTHHAVEMVYGNNAVPFKTGDTKGEKAYETAVMQDVVTAHLAFGEDGKEISRVAIGRCDTDYNAKKGKTAALQEFIVGVPQLISHYGMDHVAKLAPGLTRFFVDDFAKACNVEIAKHPLAKNLPANEPPGKPTVGAGLARVDPKEVTADFLGGVVEKELLIRHGVPTAPPDKMAVNSGYFKVQGPKEQELKDKVALVKAALERALESNALPPSLSGADFALLIKTVADGCDTGATAEELDRAVGATAQQFVRQAHKEYVEHRKKNGPPLTEAELAEAIVREAAYKALETSENRDKLDPAKGPDMNDDKHKKLAEYLAGTLSKDLNAANADPWKFVDTRAGVLAADKTSGFFTKHYNKFDVKVRGKTMEHVVIDIKKAKRTWIANFVG
jgi:ankyrin repeat protein